MISETPVDNILFELARQTTEDSRFSLSLLESRLKTLVLTPEKMCVYEVDLPIVFDHEFCKLGRLVEEAQSPFIRRLTLLLWSVHLSARGQKFRPGFGECCWAK